MALHDPESSAREHALALKIGRKKRIEMINGEPVEQDYYDDEDDEEEEDEDEEDDEEYDYVEAEDEAPIEQDEIHENILPGELMKQQETIMAVGEDGNTNYMVVEVINMEEEHEDQLQMQDKDETMDEMAELYLEEDPLESNKDEGDEKDMSNCFGFVVSILLFRCTYHVAQMHSWANFCLCICRRKMALKMRTWINQLFNWSTMWNSPFIKLWSNLHLLSLLNMQAVDNMLT